MHRLFAAAILATVAATTAIAVPAAAQTRPAAAQTRPAEDTKRDSARKPADMVKFANIKPGSNVADFIPGGGYFTRVFSIAVGPAGTVTAIIPAAAETRDAKSAAAVRDLPAQGFTNVKVVVSPLDPSLAGKLDVLFTAQNYHDLHNSLPPEGVAGFNKAVFAALKPGGFYVIIDHAALPGSGLTATKELHRIDAETVRAEVVAAGFVLDGESTVLANPQDSHDKIVFDPSIRGFTDQFALRFKKP